jgi:hypothetical protein
MILPGWSPENGGVCASIGGYGIFRVVQVKVS